MRLLGAENEYIVVFKMANFGPEVVGLEIDHDIMTSPDSPILYAKNPTGVILTFQNSPLQESWLKNGGRVYRDLDYSEYATPECETLKELVLTEKIGEKIISRMFKHQDKENIYIMKRTSSAEYYNEFHQEKTAGSHENYLINRNLFLKLTKKEPPYYNEQIALVGHLASRIIYTGAGHISLTSVKDLNKKINFWISPRVYFLKYIVSEANRMDRPFIHARKESLMSDKIQKERLHLICGDMNRSPWSLYLKYGATALFLAYLEIASPEKIKKLAESLHLLKEINFAITLSGKMSSILKTQGEFGDAINMQIRIIAAIEQYENEIKEMIPEAGKIFEIWKKTINSLTVNDNYLSDKLDWMIKKKIYEGKTGLPLQDFPKIKEIKLIDKILRYDFSYHRVNHQDYFAKLVSTNRVASLYDAQDENYFFDQPPKGRAVKRVEILKYIIKNNLQSYISNQQLWYFIELYKQSPKTLGLDVDTTNPRSIVYLDDYSLKELKLKVDNFKNSILGD